MPRHLDMLQTNGFTQRSLDFPRGGAKNSLDSVRSLDHFASTRENRTNGCIGMKAPSLRIRSTHCSWG